MLYTWNAASRGAIRVLFKLFSLTPKQSRVTKYTYVPLCFRDELLHSHESDFRSFSFISIFMVSFHEESNELNDG